MDQIQITQMTHHELENLIERVLVRVLNRYVESQDRHMEKQTLHTEKQRIRDAEQIVHAEKQRLKAADTESRVLTFEQGCKYLGYAKSYVYKLTSAGILPYSKPNHKSIFFDREKLEEWMLSNANKSHTEKEVEAATYVSTHPN